MSHAATMDHGALRADSLSPAIRAALRISGWLLSAAALVFFCKLVIQNGLTLRNRGATETIGLIGAGALLYGAAVGLLALIWSVLAAPRIEDKSKRKALAISYLKSQFAKYLPGNIFQYATRHALGRQIGIDHGSLASAAILEAVLLISAASFVVALLGAALVKSLFANAPSIPAIAALLVFLIVPMISYLPWILKWQWLPRHGMGQVTIFLIGYLVFFCVFGCLFLAILTWSTGDLPPVPQVLSSASLAWLVGFLVPGAPAGAGLRETALTLAAGVQKEGSEVLSAIVLFRLVTLLGDLFAFFAGCWMSRRMTGPVPPG